MPSSPKSVLQTSSVVEETVEQLDLNKAYPNNQKKCCCSSSPVVEPLTVSSQNHETARGGSGCWTVCPTSQKALRTRNPIRAIVDPIVKNIQSGEERGDGKDHISLALGDPTVGGNLPPCQLALDAIVAAVSEKPNAAGYIHACGLPAARQAIAEHHSYPEHAIAAENVIVASGCSGSLELVLTALLDPGTSILVPQPGFPLYEVIAESHGASVVHYRLDPNRNWEIDLEHLEEIMSDSTASGTIRGILINNPSNPTGAVFSRQHLQDIVTFCNQYQLPIVSDEVYGNLTYGSNQFHPMAQIAAQCGKQVPVITTSGLAKQYLLPGWRVGWVTFHDNMYHSLQEVEAGAKSLSQVILGASHLVQSVIPKLLSPCSQIDLWKENLRKTLETQAGFLYRELSKCNGLEPFAPQGAMYSMVKFDINKLDLKDDLDFSSRLLQEENVFVLPGTAFGCPNVFRVVFCCDEPILGEAARRIAGFCERHAN